MYTCVREKVCVCGAVCVRACACAGGCAGGCACMQTCMLIHSMWLMESYYKREVHVSTLTGQSDLETRSAVLHNVGRGEV